ncbi:MAG: hypothetical protein U0930_18990 [Pirellulales bacterium]
MVRSFLSIAIGICLFAPSKAQQVTSRLLDSNFQLSRTMNLDLLRSAKGLSDEVLPIVFESVTIARTNSLLNSEGFEATFDRDGYVSYRGAATPNIKGWGKARVSPDQYSKLCYIINQLDLDNPNRHSPNRAWDRPVTLVRIETVDGTTVINCDQGSEEEVEFKLLTNHVQHLLDSLDQKEGFNIKSGLEPKQSVIQASSKRDYGFEGMWIPIAPAKYLEPVETYELRIDHQMDYTALFSDASGKRPGKLEFSIRTHEISESDPRAIVEIETKNLARGSIRRLLVAEVKDDQLRDMEDRW